MKPSFHIKTINGPFEDPGLYVRLLREGQALMFDLGFTTSLSSRDILKTTHIFVTHTHVDHFIGFDNVLRVCLKRESPLCLYGPEGFTECVEGKLRGYTWNVIGDYPLVIEVSEVSESFVQKSVFNARNSFIREPLNTSPFSGILLANSFCKVSAAVLDHQIPCLAFSLEENYHINIDKSKLAKLDLPVGHWLSDLKTAIREGLTDRIFNINGREMSFKELRDIAVITKGQKISYVMDAVGSRENIKKIIALVRNSDTLYIETYFLDEDSDRAKDRYHLTAREAGCIAREAGVGRLEGMHFSPRYMHSPEKLVSEALAEYRFMDQ